MNEKKVLLDIELIVKSKDEDRYSFLTELLNVSNSYKILDTVALAINELEYSKGLPFLIKRIKDPFTRNHNSTLLFACSSFNCSEYIDDLISVFINDNYHASLEAMQLLIENCNYDNDKIEKILNLIEEHSIKKSFKGDKEDLYNHFVEFLKEKLEMQTYK